MTRSMTSSLFVGVIAIAGVATVAASGCKATGVGDPCTPEQEYNADFNGFSADEVNVESKSFQCQTRLCLVNHFQGRVSCAYGQDADGNAPSKADPCKVPGSTQVIDGKSNGQVVDPKKKATVPPQCTDRKAANTVYCSCRCSNINGATDDGAVYCKCPEGFECKQLVTSIGQGNEGLTGGYCIKNGTNYDSNNACGNTCDPTTQKCD